MESLFVYGTLGLGHPNACILKKIGGTFRKGHVAGIFINEGWGAEKAIPVLSRITQGIVCKDSLTSDNLQHHWHVLDDFEGSHR